MFCRSHLPILAPGLPHNQSGFLLTELRKEDVEMLGNDSNLLIVFYVQIMPDDLVMQLHRF
ncbi:hypothetical protein B5H90_19380 [Shigella dysenteriae]|nr:hypothetical protein [Shigella dysenteriae]